jgi:threonine/homoserine/homoserine lactone efflux protein
VTYLLLGISLGFSAGISPGPLLTLVITRTLAHGFSAGLRVALSPLLTDAPIILLCVLLFTVLPTWLETAVTAAGGLLLLYLGVETFWSARHATLQAGPDAQAAATTDLWHGALVNALSPHPWLFWMTLGAPTLVRAWQASPLSAFAFLLGFYVLLVGGKIAVALAVEGGRRFLSDSWYRRILAATGILLCLFGLLLFQQLLHQWI